MAVLVDTSVWSLVLRRQVPQDVPHTAELRRALLSERVATTGVIVQEILVGVTGAEASQRIAERFASLEYVTTGFNDHVAAAALQTELRSAGVQLSGADALIAHLAITHDLTLLTTDRDFTHAARHIPLRVWG